jgi:hypothetical protein
MTDLGEPCRVKDAALADVSLVDFWGLANEARGSDIRAAAEWS